MAYICPVFWCKFSFLYNGNVLPFPFIFLFPAFPTPHMNHFSHEAFSRMISLPAVFLFPSRNFHCGTYCSALSSFYESHPLGMNFLVAEDSFFSLYFPCLEICEWNGTRLPPHRRVNLAKTDCISAGARLVHRAWRVQNRTHRLEENWQGEKPKHQFCAGRGNLVGQIVAQGGDNISRAKWLPLSQDSGAQCLFCEWKQIRHW